MNVLSGLHYRESTELFGHAALLDACMEEMTHGRNKQKLHTTSGRDTLIELMKAENFREAARYLYLVSAHPFAAQTDPAIQALPQRIRDELINMSIPPEQNALRALLLPRPTSTPYVAKYHNVDKDVSPNIRTGPTLRTDATLTEFERRSLAYLTATKLHNIPTSVDFIASVTLPFHPRRKGTIWADFQLKGITHYAVDGVVGNEMHAGIVRLHSVFLFEEEVYACVTWGIKTHLHAQTGFQGYTFEALSEQARAKAERRLCSAALSQKPCQSLGWKSHKGESLIRATRLVAYVHFGETLDGLQWLNPYYE